MLYVHMILMWKLFSYITLMSTKSLSPRWHFKYSHLYPTCFMCSSRFHPKVVTGFFYPYFLLSIYIWPFFSEEKPLFILMCTSLDNPVPPLSPSPESLQISGLSLPSIWEKFKKCNSISWVSFAYTRMQTKTEWISRWLSYTNVSLLAFHFSPYHCKILHAPISFI